MWNCFLRHGLFEDKSGAGRTGERRFAAKKQILPLHCVQGQDDSPQIYGNLLTCWLIELLVYQLDGFSSDP